MDIRILVVILCAIVMPIAFTFFFVWWYNKSRDKTSTNTQRLITDREILELIDAQPDGLLSAKQLAAQTELSTSQAKVRLSTLLSFGALKSHYASNFQGYFSLVERLDKRMAPKLSEEPFLTVEDILALFRHFEFRLTPLKLIMATGLPITILKREIKYFQKQKILQSLTQSSHHSGVGSRSLVLLEPYRSNPERFLEKQLDLNRQVETILRKDDLV